MIFRKMRPIASHTLSSLNTTNTCHITPLPTILALWHSRVHIHTIDRCNIASYIKSPIYYGFGILTCLGVPDVDPYNSHVRFGRHLDNVRLWSKYDVVEDVIILEDFFNFIWSNTTVSFLTNKRDTHNLEVRFGLRKSCWWHLICIRRKWVFNVFLNFLKIQSWCNIVGCKNYTFVFNIDKIC